MTLSKVHGIRLLLSDLFFALAAVSGVYYIWIRTGTIFSMGLLSTVSVVFEVLIVVLTLYYMYVFLHKEKRKNELTFLKPVSGTVDVFVVIENRDIEAVKTTLESVNNLNTGLQVYKFLVCDNCGPEIEIFADEYKCRLLKDDEKHPFNANGIKLAFLKSEAKYMVFVKSGTRLAENFLRKTVPHFVDENVCMVQGGRKILFDRVVNVSQTSRLLSVLGSKYYKIDVMSDDADAFLLSYTSGKKFSLAEWNGVIIEREEFVKHVSELQVEIVEDVGLFEDYDDDEDDFVATSDDEDFVPPQVNQNLTNDLKVTEEFEELLDEDGAKPEDIEGFSDDESEIPDDEDSTQDITEEEDAGIISDDITDETANLDETLPDTETGENIDETVESDEEVKEESEINEKIETENEEGTVENGDKNEVEEEPFEIENDEEPQAAKDEIVEPGMTAEQSEAEVVVVDIDDDSEDYEEDDDSEDYEDDTESIEEVSDANAGENTLETVPLMTNEKFIVDGIPEDLLYSLEVFKNKNTKAVLLPDILIEKAVGSSLHERILFDVGFFEKVKTAYSSWRKLKSKDVDKEVGTLLLGTLAGFMSQILVYFWGIYLVLVSSLQLSVINETDFLRVLPAFIIFIVSLELRALLLYGGEGFFTKIKKLILAPYYLGFITIRYNESENVFQVDRIWAYIRFLLISLNLTAILTTLIKINYYYEPRLNIAMLVMLVLFFGVLFSSLLFFFTLSRKEAVETK